jgi:hypothetical protein
MYSMLSTGTACLERLHTLMPLLTVNTDKSQNTQKDLGRKSSDVFDSLFAALCFDLYYWKF